MPQFKWISYASDSCYSCTRWNNKVFKTIAEVPDQPVHPNCRCMLEVIKSPEEEEFLKLGHDIKNIFYDSKHELYDLIKLISDSITHQGLRTILEALIQDFTEVVRASYIFLYNYIKMRNANHIGADKYFHSKANAQAAQVGSTAEAFAELVSGMREHIDYYKNLHLKKLSLEATLKDAQEDQYANVFGREQGRKSPYVDA